MTLFLLYLFLLDIRPSIPLRPELQDDVDVREVGLGIVLVAAPSDKVRLVECLGNLGKSVGLFDEPVNPIGHAVLCNCVIVVICESGSLEVALMGRSLNSLADVLDDGILSTVGKNPLEKGIDVWLCLFGVEILLMLRPNPLEVLYVILLKWRCKSVEGERCLTGGLFPEDRPMSLHCGIVYRGPRVRKARSVEGGVLTTPDILAVDRTDLVEITRVCHYTSLVMGTQLLTRQRVQFFDIIS
jgi:hypothetical protein